MANLKPQQRADKTRAKIIKAAKELFVKNGYAGTAMNSISKLANVNHSLLFHHFKNKAGLWLAVKENIFSSLERKTVVPELDQPFKSFMKHLLVEKINFYHDNPDVISMINWQRIEADKNELAIGISQEAQNWIKAIEHFQKAGDISSRHEPGYIITLILSIASTAAMDPIIFIKDKKHFDEYIAFCVGVLCKSLA